MTTLAAELLQHRLPCEAHIQTTRGELRQAHWASHLLSVWQRAAYHGGGVDVVRLHDLFAIGLRG